jgi:hypothetical protein
MAIIVTPLRGIVAFGILILLICAAAPAFGFLEVGMTRD